MGNANAGPRTLVIFGATGDLMRRKLTPALYRLQRKGRLSEGIRIVGVAPSDLTSEAFRTTVEESLRTYSGNFDPDEARRFAARVSFVRGDFSEAATSTNLREHLDRLEGEATPRLYYLAVAPRFFIPAVRFLQQGGLVDAATAPRNLVIEKPFGRDGDSARDLNAALHAVFSESQIYRIDHYLGKETAQNILLFRFANTIFEPIWNRNYIDHVQITVAETVDVGSRAGYYDQAGVFRDMFQNHLLQLLTLVAMEPPAPANATTLRDEKVKVLSAIQPVGAGDAICGQYEGYCGNPGVGEHSMTPTFGALRLEIDNWRWQGVPFYLRSGKALAEKASTISVEFKRPPTPLFGASQSPEPNVLSLCIQPDEGLHLQFVAKVPDHPSETRPVEMEFHYRSSFPDVSLPDAYERLLLDALNGDASLFARSDEIERAWALIDPVIAEAQRGTGGTIPTYPRGSWGPEASMAMLARDGRAWRTACGHAEDRDGGSARTRSSVGT
jgi:glucose-6-phosphate 1-dehydrogenase